MVTRSAAPLSSQPLAGLDEQSGTPIRVVATMVRLNELATPSSSLVRRYVAEFDADVNYSAPDRALAALFAAYPSNSRLEEVLIKVSALNSLYATNIFAIVDAARHIRESGIDDALSEGSPTVVDLIASMRLGGKVRRNYSFATKYCSWHNPNSYPIYDNYVDAVLWAYRRRDGFLEFKRTKLRNYGEFRKILSAFVKHYSLEEFTPKELDKFLWLYGRSELSSG